MGCGNYLENSIPTDHEAKGRSRTQDLYAGGVDGVSVRLQVSVAALKGWSSAGLDIKTAFLGAPMVRVRPFSFRGTCSLVIWILRSL